MDPPNKNCTADVRRIAEPGAYPSGNPEVSYEAVRRQPCQWIDIIGLAVAISVTMAEPERHRGQSRRRATTCGPEQNRARRARQRCHENATVGQKASNPIPALEHIVDGPGDRGRAR